MYTRSQKATHYEKKGSRFVRNVGTIHVLDDVNFPSPSSEIQKFQPQNFIDFPLLFTTSK